MTLGAFTPSAFGNPSRFVETLVDDGDGDHGVDQAIVDLKVQQRRAEKRDGVAERERGYEFHDVPELREKEHHAEQE
jgi:hypothetical protein